MIACSQTLDAFNPNPNNAVFASAIQPDGRMLVGGYFGKLGDVTRGHIARLDADGNVDPDFNPSASGAISSGPIVGALAVQPDGKILVGGDFIKLGGQSRRCLGRVNADGLLDSTFDPNPDYRVQGMALQPDGKILVGGLFGMLGGQPRARIGRLNPDGSLDPGFNPGANDEVSSFALQTNGQILVGGYFTSLGGQPRGYLGRLNSDGSLDTSFNPGASNVVFCLVVQPDQKILVGGGFSGMAGQTRNGIARLLPDGTLDASFDPGADGVVYSLAQQANGAILVGGAFTTLAGQPANRIGRLNPDGSRDAGFQADANATVYGLTLQPDGRILAGGTFSTLNSQPRSCLGRLTNPDPAADNLALMGSTLSWTRTGACPEVSRTRFDATTNGVDWFDVGAGVRSTNAWQLDGVVFPFPTTFRARGFLAGAFGGRSSWFAEQSQGPLVISTQPKGRTNLATTIATFVAPVVGSSPLIQQWYKDGVALTNGGNVSGAPGAFLSLSNVLGPDAGSFWMVASNALGAVTSSVVMLSVVDPWITNQPAGRIATAGQSVTLSVSAAGSPPNYQWRKEGTNLPGATSASLTLTNVQGANAGYYSVVVSNAFGSVTSAVVLLTVNAAYADSFSPTADAEVFGMSQQPDGKILIGGAFTLVNGVSRYRHARLTSGGALDPSYAVGFSDQVFGISFLPDGRILASGLVSLVFNQTRKNIIRLNLDGSTDAGFTQIVSGGTASPAIYAAVLQPDGKVIVGGDFRTLGGQSRTNIGRLNANGTLDTVFAAAADGIVYSMALQPDGRIIVGGDFTNLCGNAALRLGRLNASGSFDTSFSASASDVPLALLVQPDNKILVGGHFTNLSNQARSRIGRLESDGSVDAAFNPGASGSVRSLALQADGRILVGGLFSSLGGQSRTNFGRLRPEGMLDPTFNPGADGVIYGLTVQSDGKILVGGSFGFLDGKPRSRLGRLINTDPITESLTFDGSTITWLRGGSSPEVLRTSFDASLDGINWMTLGNGQRIPGGWNISGLNLPTTTIIRARGFVTGGRYCSSIWFVESTLNLSPNRPPVILTENAHFGFVSNKFGFDVAGLTLGGVVVDASTNFSVWTPLWTNFLGNGPVYFADPRSTNFPRRFYRARLQ